MPRGVFNLDPDSDKDPRRAQKKGPKIFLKIWMFFQYKAGDFT
jgi:hypothetical protein